MSLCSGAVQNQNGRVANIYMNRVKGLAGDPKIKSGNLSCAIEKNYTEIILKNKKNG